jgi:hypothetical protein
MKLLILMGMVFMVGSAVYGMDETPPPSPTLQSTNSSLEDACGCLRGLAIFVGHLINDLPAYMELMLEEQPQPPHTNQYHSYKEIPYATQASWGLHPTTRTQSGVVQSIALKMKND